MAHDIDGGSKTSVNSIKSLQATVLSTDVSSTAAKSTTIKKNIDAINSYLDSLMRSSPEERQKARDILSTKTNNTKAAIPLPSYNTRTPYIEIYINGIMLVPTGVSNLVDSSWNDTTRATYSNPNYVKEMEQWETTSKTPGAIQYDDIAELDVLFKSLSLDMPIGGVLGTITGTLQLYSRNPIDFLEFLWDFDNEASAGLPECKLRFGWSISRTDGQVEKLLTPFLSLLITNTGISDPGRTLGSDFTITLQDPGSAVLQNSSAYRGLRANYPQEQLRVILEKTLGFRLFTLDDILYMKSETATTVNTKTETTNNTTTKVEKTTTNSIEQTKTFFVNEQAPAFRTNSNTLEIVIQDLLNMIMCRWYPSDNTNLPNEISDAKGAEEQIKALRHQYDTTTNYEEKQTLKAQIEEQAVKIASACCLIWVPFFPAGILTTSNDSEISKETGAFVLLPKTTSNYDLTSDLLPLIYGPGGSSMPYFYGGAQNVFAVLTEAVNGSRLGYSNMVGEVLSFNANFSNLVALMKNNYDEAMTYRQNGKFIKPSNTVYTRKELEEIKAEKLKELGATNSSEYISKWRAKNLPKFKAIKQRFKQSIAPRDLVSNSSFTNANSDKDSARLLAMNKLKHRIGTFLNYPFTASLQILGDPYLIRQGIGAFELINYYPNITGSKLRFNALVSGVYTPTKISYNLTMGDFTTTIQAIKVPESVANTTQARIESVISTAATKGDTDNDTAVQQNAELLLNMIKEVDLENIESVSVNQQATYTLSDKLKLEYDKHMADYTAELKKNGVADSAMIDMIKAEKQKVMAQYIKTGQATQNAASTKDPQVRYNAANVQSQVGLLNYTIGMADSKDVKESAGTGRISTLDALYTKLKDSRYTDLLDDLSKQINK